ncbi:MAG: hypothetical protein ACK5IQ_03940 [Bacteroidales bacterium]
MKYIATVNSKGKAIVRIDGTRDELSCGKILKGWWINNENNSIKKALLTDTVRFHVQTKDIPNNETVKIEILDEDSIPLISDDRITSSKLNIINNQGFVDIDLNSPTLRDTIISDIGNEIELYAKCQYNKSLTELANSPEGQLKVYDVGYIPFEDCRINVCIDGRIEFLPEHFGVLARGEWNKLNFPYKYEAKVYYDQFNNPSLGGIPRTIDKIVINKPSSPRSNLNINDKNVPTYNQSNIKVAKPIAKSTGLPDRRYSNRTVNAAPVGRPVAAGAVLALSLALMSYDVAVPFAVNKEQSKIKEHYGILKLASQDLNIAYSNNMIPDNLLNTSSISAILNVILCGKREVSDEEFSAGKKIYTEISKFSKIQNK